MTIKICTCCKQIITTKTAVKIGTQDSQKVSLAMFNCSCGSTFTIKKNKKAASSATKESQRKAAQTT